MGALKLEEVDRYVDNKRKLPIYLIFPIKHSAPPSLLKITRVLFLIPVLHKFLRLSAPCFLLLPLPSFLSLWSLGPVL